MKEKKPFWLDKCNHGRTAEQGSRLPGVFIGSTIDPEDGDKWDVYLFTYNSPLLDNICIRHGNERGDYVCFKDIKEWIDPYKTEMVTFTNEKGYTQTKEILASCLYGTAMELIRSYLWEKENVGTRIKG